MTLIKSVSGIRGTIGGLSQQNLTPLDIVNFTSAFASMLKAHGGKKRVVVGRDGRISGSMVKRLVSGTLQAMGIDVLDADLSTTPSVEMYIPLSGADGGIMITASHNPMQWNALKFFNDRGEFISEEIGKVIIETATTYPSKTIYAEVHELGSTARATDVIEQHIQAILNHPLIDARVIEQARLKFVVDCINSTGAISMAPLLDALGVSYELINEEVHGRFAHNPEPLPEHLTELSSKVIETGADGGISVDPDVDRLAFIESSGKFFGEEYTLVCAADYVLGKTPGPVVTNLSSTLALKDLANSYGQSCFYAPVGEVHVVKEMKQVMAVLGGEGNGGVIDPSLHYGRDAMVGTALILMHLAETGKSLQELKAQYVHYEMVKDKISFDPSQRADVIITKIRSLFTDNQIDEQDGLKILLSNSWVQIRKSNTEPILRIYAEARTKEEAQSLVDKVKSVLPE